MKAFLSLSFILVLSACAGQGTAPPSHDLTLKPSSFSQLPGWKNENFKDFAIAYERSCKPLLKRESQNLFFSKSQQSNLFGKNQSWQIACRKFDNINKNDQRHIRNFFEQNFIPYQARAASNLKGLFTGYYEAGLNGSKTKKEPYQYPLRARPSDLVMVQLGEFRDDLKGRRIAGRVVNGKLKPYESHAEINDGDLPKSQDKTLVWVDDPVDAFFLQIQGSGIVQLDNSEIMRLGYAGQNGHPYYAIGRELVKRGYLEKQNVSMQSIRAWLATNPDQAQEIMETNKSYVFFQELDGEGPIGGQGVALTPKRSLAIDRSIVPYGMPVWVDIEAPVDGNEPLRRLMVTQDTGGAIRGPVRGDFFWGYGSQAEEMAGLMKSQGQYWFLLPK
ncbi:MAG: MltA domain-containing protein [Pseudomonadota bacterium]